MNFIISLITICFSLWIPPSLGLLKTYTMNDFRMILRKSKNLVVITGAGVSAESGVPTFRSVRGLWRNKSIESMASIDGFRKDPSSVWEFYHYRRQLVLNTKPNAAHFAIAECERWFKEKGANFTLITANVDGLHQAAGSQNVLEMHGSLLETKCTVCDEINRNVDSPICKSLEGKEKNFNKPFMKSDIPRADLPHCKRCGGLLRPNVVWFMERLNNVTLANAWKVVKTADVGVIIGLANVVIPIGLFGNVMARNGAVVAEFNIRKGPYTDSYRYFYKGPAAEMVPKALDKMWEKRKERGSSFMTSTSYDDSTFSRLNLTQDSFYSNSLLYQGKVSSFKRSSQRNYRNEIAGVHTSREESYSSSDPIQYE